MDTSFKSICQIRGLKHQPSKHFGSFMYLQYHAMDSTQWAASHQEVLLARQISCTYIN